LAIACMDDLFYDTLHCRQVIQQPSGKTRPVLVFELHPYGSGVLIVRDLKVSQATLQQIIKAIQTHIPFKISTGK
jgi:hypothetical protein